MKSLWISAPFWKTESGIVILGLPEVAKATGTSLRRVLFSMVLRRSTSVGGVVIDGGQHGVRFGVIPAPEG